MATKTRFSGQLDGEEVIIYQRRHGFAIIKWVGVRALLFLLVSLVIAWGVTEFLVVPSPAIRLVYWLLILSPALIWIVWRVLDWGNDRYIVTNRRVIHHEKVYLFSDERKEAYLDKVQDVTIKLINPFANVLNFGDVIIETASKAGTLKFQDISKPRDIQRLILESAGLPAAKEELNSRPRLRFLWKGIWRMLYPTYPAEEEGVIIWRKHWWVLNRDLILAVMAIFILATTWLWALTGLELEYPGWINLLFILGLVIIAIWIVYELIDWHNDLYILTKDRVIDIEKKPFVFEHRREASLGTIQDVSLEQKGFTAKLLNFGNVLLKTAGRAGELTFDSVPRPGDVQATIAERLNEFRQQKRLADQESRRAAMVAIVEDCLRRAEGEEEKSRRAEIISIVEDYLRLAAGEDQERQRAEIISIVEDYLRRRKADDR